MLPQVVGGRVMLACNDKKHYPTGSKYGTAVETMLVSAKHRVQTACCETTSEDRSGSGPDLLYTMVAWLAPSINPSLALGRMAEKPEEVFRTIHSYGLEVKHSVLV